MSRNPTAKIHELLAQLENKPGMAEAHALMAEASKALARCKTEQSRAKKRQLLTRLMGSPDPGAESAESIRRTYERRRLGAAKVGGGDRNHGIVVSINIPEPYAKKWPDPVAHNHGHPPHLTCLYVASEMTHAEASQVLHCVRAAARTIAPFRVFVDAGSGLQDFGDTDKGEKALWMPARSEPRGELGRLHRVLRLALEREGVKIESFNDYRPHVTWAYVPNGFAEADRRRLDAHIVDRFDRGFWFDVRHLYMSMPDGRVKVVALNPVPRSSLY